MPASSEVNVDGAQNVLDLKPTHARLVYASTGSNYGEVDGICTEETPLNPVPMDEPKLKQSAFLSRPP